MNKYYLPTLFVSCLLVLGCGGGGSKGDSDGNGNGNGNGDGNGDGDGTVVENLLFGFYKEDIATNPEDPTVGSLYLTIPEDDGVFSGSMSFTYVGCQTSNVGSVSGNKTSSAMNATWSGTVDGTSQSGNFTGSSDTGDSSYSGNYTVAKGKQEINIDGCIDYFIAPKGTWSLYPVNTSLTFDGSVAGSCDIDVNYVTSWSPPAFEFSVVAVIDEEKAETGASDAIVYQQYTVDTSLQLPASLESGKKYVATFVSMDSTGKVVYACNQAFFKN